MPARTLRLTLSAAALALLAGAAIGTGHLTHGLGAEGSVKVRMPVGAAVDARATLVAQYESFNVYEAPGAAANDLTKAGGEVIEEANRILLNAGPLDTTTPAVKALQQPIAAFEGKAMHLIQFAGPIQPAWYDQLSQTGVQIVTAIPSNAYLVYGDAKQLQALQAMALPQVQWN